MTLAFSFFLTLVTLALPLPHVKRWHDIVEKHAWVEVPSGWVYEGPAPQDQKFSLRIALKHDRVDELIANLMETSDPLHDRYGQHLTPTQAEAFVAAHPSSHAAVADWLEYQGIAKSAITHTSGGGDYLTFVTTIAQAERMLHTTYGVYSYAKSGERVVRALSYALPRELHEHIGFISPTTYFGMMRSMHATHLVQPQKVTPAQSTGPGSESVLGVNGTIPTSCQGTITPLCLRELYNAANYVVKGGTNNAIGIAGYGSYANRADLQTFFKEYRTDAVGSSYTTVLVNGGLDDQSEPGIEANLDIQYATGMACPIPATYWSTGGSPPFTPDENTPTNDNEPFLDWLHYVLSRSTIPQVITTSYGEPEQTVPQDYATQVCNLFAQLGSVGTSVFFSSGNHGVGRDNCVTNDGTNRILFQPHFPASCPYVTTVGATTGTSPEIALSLSGGGFSRYFSQPSYQSSAVSTYLTNLGSKYTGFFTPTGRAYPDVSAQGSGFQIIVGGSTLSVTGTSASTPTLAGIFALLNDHRLTEGKSSLGFLNPLIYSSAHSGFTDITFGSNPGCKTKGFSSTTGWDPVTGLGTPDFAKLQTLV